MKIKIPKIYLKCNLLFDNNTLMEQITREIGTNPSSSKNKRDQRKSHLNDNNLEAFWSIETEMIETFDFEDVSKIMVNRLNPYLTRIKQTIIKYEGTVDFIIIPNFYSQQAPALCFNCEFLDVVNYLNAKIQIDMQVE